MKDGRKQGLHIMKAAIQLYAFWYGCIGAICFALWQIIMMMGHISLPNNWIWVELAFGLHALAAIATFNRGQLWLPLLSVTRGRILAAKSILAVATLNLLLCLGWLFYTVIVGSQDPSGLGVGLILASFLLQNCIYIALHWAFRSENLFSQAFIRGISDPLSFIFRGDDRA